MTYVKKGATRAGVVPQLSEVTRIVKNVNVCKLLPIHIKCVQ